MARCNSEHTHRYCMQCGRELDRWHKKYCNSDCQELYLFGKIREKNNRKAEPGEYRCKCPACGNVYLRKLDYVPKMMPRLYCEDHEHYRDRSEAFDGEVY